MNLHQKVYQLFILGIDEKNIYNALESGLGGVIFFTEDILSKEDFINSVNKIKKHALISPFLSIDQEGGRVERTENIWHGKKYLSQKFAFEKGENFLKEQTQKIAEELLTYGINLNFSPCIDVNTNPNNPIIGERAFSDNTDKVINGAKIVTETYQKNGIIPCVKHFPGHGDASADSHMILPKIALALDEMEKEHIKPFKEMILYGIEMVMTAHLHCSCFDREIIPASLSSNAVNYLRNKLNFKGVIVSDDMVMGALNNFDNPLETSLRAGVNLFIYRDSDDKTIDTIEDLYKKACSDEILRKKIEESYQKIFELKKKYIL